MIDQRLPVRRPVANRFAAHRDGAVLVVRGDVDLGSAGTLARLLTDPTITTVDLADVTFIDSGGLKVLIGARQDRRADSELGLRAPSRFVLRLLQLNGLEHHLPIAS